MSYTPPNIDAIDFNVNDNYIPPANYSLNFVMGVDSAMNITLPSISFDALTGASLEQTMPMLDVGIIAHVHNTMEFSIFPTVEINTGAVIDISLPLPTVEITAKYTGSSIIFELPSLDANLITGINLETSVFPIVSMGAINGTVGDIEATLPSIYALCITGAELDVSLPFVGVSAFVPFNINGSLHFNLPLLSCEIDTSVENLSDLTVNIPFLNVSISTGDSISARIQSTIPFISCNMTSIQGQSLSLEATTPILSFRASAGDHSSYLEMTIPFISAEMEVGGETTCVPLEYVRGVIQ